MADVKWIKIATDVFNDEKIMLIESMPEADSIIVIWFKLLCFAGQQNNDGVFLLNDRIAYTDEMFATIFRRPLNTVRLALKTFEEYGMVQIINNAVTIPNWSKHQTLDQIERKREYMRTYMQRRREAQRLLAESNCNDHEIANNDETTTNSDDVKLTVKPTVKPLLEQQNKNKNIYKYITHAHAREEEPNPYGDGDCELPTDTVQQYALDNIPVMGYRAMEELASFIEDLSDEIVRHAIDNALDNGVKTWGYVKSILNKYAEEGVKTVGEAKAIDEQFKKNKQKHDAEPKAETKKAEDMTQEELEYAMNHGPYGKFY